MSVSRVFLFALALASVACSREPEPVAVDGDGEPAQALAYPASAALPVAVTVEPQRADLDIPDRCDRLALVKTPSGLQLSKRPPSWLRSDRARAEYQAWVRGVVEIVGDELGADALAREVIYRKAILESSGNPGAVHVRSADVAANRRAARRGRETSSERWARARVPVEQRVRGAWRVVDDYDAWALGRGLYGQVTGLHLARWSTDAPPWALCDPVIATVTVIWSMRAGLAKCHGSTLRDAYRRFSSGRCALREPARERAFDVIARGHVRGLRLSRFDPDAPADFGERWPEATTDRAILLARLRRRIADEVGPEPSPSKMQGPDTIAEARQNSRKAIF